MKKKDLRLKTKRILVDGFNLIYKFETLHSLMKSSQLQTAFKKLNSILNQYSIIANKDITVVYDGKKKEGDNCKEETVDSILVIYSHKQTADKVIMNLIKNDNFSGDVTVISSDKQIISFVQRFKSYTLRSEDFEKIVSTALLEKPDSEEIENESISNEEIDYWTNIFKTGI